jgi:serine/threonine protein kinase
MNEQTKFLAASMTFKWVSGNLEQIAEPSPISAKESDELIGQVVDTKYRIISRIGHGGMGVVYKAHHLLLDNDVALKMLRCGDLSPEIWQRFQREAKAMTRLDNRNIVRVFDFGVGEGNRPYFTMELLEGESLAERISRQGTIHPAQVMKIFLAIAEGLVSAHARGIVHRDLKPGNIFLVTETEKDQVTATKLIDFGIAKLVESGSIDEQSQTATGTVFGSPLYMSPEQASGGHVDERSDIYSYACALFEALTGRPPFVGPNFFATICCHLNNSPPSLADYAPKSNFPYWLEQLVAKMLQKDKSERIQSFSEIVAILSFNQKAFDNLAPVSQQVRAGVGSSSAPGQETSNTIETGITGKRFNWMPFLLSALFVVTLVLFLGPNLLGKNLANQSAKTSATTSANAPSAVAELISPFGSSPQAQEASQASAGDPDRNVPRYFQGMAGSPSDPEKVFQFGKDLLGNFEHGPGGNDIPCIGLVKIKSNKYICFHPGELFLKNPSLFKGFYSNDLEALSLRNSNWEAVFWTDKHIHAISHITGVKNLYLDESEADADAIPDLNKFRHLRVLSIPKTGLTGTDLSRLTNIAPLEILSLEKLVHIDEFLRADATKMPRLNTLNLSTCGLTDASMSDIAKIKSLCLLNLDHNHITEVGLKELTALPHLAKLNLKDDNFGPGAFPLFLKMKKLDFLELSSTELTESDIVKLRKLLPKCSVVALSLSLAIISQCAGAISSAALADEVPPRTFSGHTGAVNSVAFSFDSTRLATAGDDLAIRIWDVASGSLLRSLVGHTGFVNAVAYNPVWSTIASAAQTKSFGSGVRPRDSSLACWLEVLVQFVVLPSVRMGIVLLQGAPTALLLFGICRLTKRLGYWPAGTREVLTRLLLPICD